MPSREPDGNKEQNADDAGDHAAPKPPSRCLGGWLIAVSRNARTTLKLLVRGNVLIHAIARWRQSYGCGPGVGPHYRCDKAVAAAGDGLDAAAFGAIAVENAAQRRNLDREIVVFDDRPRPGSSHDLVF